MAHYEAYIARYGDRDFNEMPFNEVDGLIFSQLAYVDYAGIVGGADAQFQTLLDDAARQYFALHPAEEIDNEIGIVQSGSVNVESNDLWGNKSILSHVEAGQAFAETYALCGEPLMVDVAAAEPCEILWLDLVPMLQQQNTAASWYPKFLHNLLLLSMQKNLALSQRIRCTTPKSARGRLLTYLSAQAVRAGSTHFSIPFDRQQLADYLCVDRSAMSAQLCALRDDGILKFRKNHFVLNRI